MKYYALGFMFQDNKVALIRKKRHSLLNGIGGRIKEDETAAEAMIRAFKEVTDCTVTDWRYYCQLSGPEFMVYCFYCHGGLDALKEIAICDINNLHDTVSDLKWLIPLALDNNHRIAVRVEL